MSAWLDKADVGIDGFDFHMTLLTFHGRLEGLSQVRRAKTLQKYLTLGTYPGNYRTLST